MAGILVVYYTRTGKTEAMAREVAEGARAAGAEVTVKSVDRVEIAELLDYDGIIIGSPTYYGLPSAEIKNLLDESVQMHGKLSGKVGGAFTSAGNIGGGNETTLMALLQAMLVHGMVLQGSSSGDHYGPVSIGKLDDRSRPQCVELGKRVALLVKKLGVGQTEQKPVV